MFLLHSWQEFLENSDLVRIKIIEEFRPRKPGNFGILLKNFKNSAAYKIPMKLTTVPTAFYLLAFFKFSS